MTLPAHYNPHLPDNVVDLTAYKMKACIETHKATGNLEAAKAYEEALKLYYLQELSFEWHGGQPFAIVATLEGAKILKEHGGISKEHYDQIQEEPSENDQDPEEDENENPNDSE